MKELISTIIDSYRFDEGQLSIRPETIDILQLVSDIEKENTPLLADKGQTLKIINSLQSNMIDADKLQIKRVIMNFVPNAIVYSVNDSEIELQLKSNKQNLILNVINKSKVPPTENMDDVFDKYKTLTNSKYNKTSTGLGLYLSKQIIDAHNGQIYARVQSDKRCLFGFKIPITAKPVQKTEK